MKTFPFPDRESCLELLSRDLLYSRIAECDRESLVENAWKRGESSAKSIFSRKGIKIIDVLDENELSVKRYDQDRIIGSQRFFAEINPKTKTIEIYTESIRKWAIDNDIEYDYAEQLVLAHEYFHYLEFMSMVPPSKSVYSVPILKIGKGIEYRSGVKSISEIGAYAFSYEYFKSITE